MAHTLAWITVPNPDDVDGTQPFIYDGPTLWGAAEMLTDGTYLASAEHDEDGDLLAPVDGTVTVTDGTATFRPFSRTPATVFGVTGGGDTLCGYSCPDLTGQEDVDAMVPATIGGLSDSCPVHCDGCGTTILRYDEAGATEDVRLAVLAATGVHGEVEGTGGNCTAFVARAESGWQVSVTDADASAPDGIGMHAALYFGEDDDDPTVLLDGAAHDPVALYRALRSSHMAALAAH